MSVILAEPRSAELADRIAALFPAEVSVATADPAAEEQRPVFEEETRVVANACAKRQREFRAGRAAAHRAMEQLGEPPAPVMTAPDRAPIWPGNLTGSISHSESLCAAVVADSRITPALGIDIEPCTPIEPELIPEICTLPERAYISTRPEEERGRFAKLVFSAKECAYKCQFALSQSLIEFSDIEITADLESGQFEATFTRDVAGFARGTRLCGRYVFESGHVITGIAASSALARWQKGTAYRAGKLAGALGIR